ncbi:hypothetical protein [Hymenobacter negativus]|uniref:Lipoprotein n=1 Tax=Hymenobacter negativus TaxID=2795026 RepID=A0ABS3QIJ9_9BACT|nr:hypothetical protein [Hymenobacter negativus]MBO2011075.1 hypothetical protein [Hymenobacter negativus]
MRGFRLSTVSIGCGLGCAVLALARCSGPNMANVSPPQWAADSSTVRVAAGPQYTRGAVWRFFWGRHYRDIWATPVTVPVVRLATIIPDTLTPTRAGGSYQTRSLRLCATNGHEFVLRSVDKDASAALPAGWIRWLLGGLMKDQTSVGQPYGAYVAAPLAEAAGVYHTNPSLVYLPNDPGLRRFRSGYANALYLLEERPDGNQQYAANFGHSPAVVNSRHMLLAIRKQAGTQVEARAYLRARLLDMWLGDWSRRPDQWRWASFPAAGRTSYRPIPRDRDQAFFLFDDGLITRIVSWFVPKYHSFHATIPLRTVDGLSTTARALDRTLLGSLSAADFQQEADSLRQRLTDGAIAAALASGPPETRATIAAHLAPLLRARREQLPAVAARYYEIISQESWVVGTDKPERFILSEAGAGRLRVQMLALRPGQPDSLITERVYDRQTTRHLEVYGLAGNDIFELRSTINPGFLVSVYDGAGHDQVLRPAATRADLSACTWYSRPDGDATRHQAGITIEPDPHPELTTDSHAWLKRYNLRD